MNSGAMAIVAVQTDDNRVLILIEEDPDWGAYWEALAEVRAVWAETQTRAGRENWGDAEKRRNLIRFNGYLKAAQGAAEKVGLDFHMGHVMG